MLNKMTDTALTAHLNLTHTASDIVKRTQDVLRKKDGEGHVETAVKVLIGIVVGGLILVAAYAMFKDTLIPKLQQKLMEMFNYKG